MAAPRTSLLPLFVLLLLLVVAPSTCQEEQGSTLSREQEAPETTTEAEEATAEVKVESSDSISGSTEQPAEGSGSYPEPGSSSTSITPPSSTVEAEVKESISGSTEQPAEESGSYPEPGSSSRNITATPPSSTPRSPFNSYSSSTVVTSSSQPKYISSVTPDSTHNTTESENKHTQSASTVTESTKEIAGTESKTTVIETKNYTRTTESENDMPESTSEPAVVQSRFEVTVIDSKVSTTTESSPGVSLTSPIQTLGSSAPTTPQDVEVFNTSAATSGKTARLISTPDVNHLGTDLSTKLTDIMLTHNSATPKFSLYWGRSDEPKKETPLTTSTVHPPNNGPDSEISHTTPITTTETTHTYVHTTTPRVSGDHTSNEDHTTSYEDNMTSHADDTTSYKENTTSHAGNTTSDDNTSHNTTILSDIPTLPNTTGGDVIHFPESTPVILVPTRIDSVPTPTHPIPMHPILTPTHSVPAPITPIPPPIDPIVPITTPTPTTERTHAPHPTTTPVPPTASTELDPHNNFTEPAPSVEESTASLIQVATIAGSVLIAIPLIAVVAYLVIRRVRQGRREVRRPKLLSTHHRHRVSTLYTNTPLDKGVDNGNCSLVIPTVECEFVIPEEDHWQMATANSFTRHHLISKEVPEETEV